MNIISVYADINGAVKQVLGANGIGSPSSGLLEVARFDATAYPMQFDLIAGRTKEVFFVDGNLVLRNPILPEVLIVDEVWILARKAEVEAFEAEKTTDSDARTHILQQASAALTQIENDLTAIANGKTAATAATTLAQFRTIILGMLDVMEHTCNRQDGEIRVLRAILRSGLTDT